MKEKLVLCLVAKYTRYRYLSVGDFVLDSGKGFVTFFVLLSTLVYTYIVFFGKKLDS